MKKWCEMITMGKPKALIKPIINQVIATILEAIPYGFTILVIHTFFTALTTGATLPVGKLYGLCVAFIISLILFFFITIKTYTENTETGIEICAAGQTNLADHMKKLSMGFFSTHNASDLANVLIHDFTSVQTLIGSMLPRVVSGIVFPVVCLFFLVFINPFLTFVIASIIIMAIPVAFGTTKIVRKLGLKQQRAMNEAMARMLEYIGGIRIIKAHNLGGERFTTIKQSFDALKKSSILLEGFGGPLVGLSVMILGVILPLLIYLGSQMLAQGSLLPLEFMTFLIFGLSLAGPLITALTFSIEIIYYTVAAQRIQNVFDTEALEVTEPVATPTDTTFEMKQVSFAYTEHGAEVLHHINCCFKPRTMNALVGPSGSGKSTITKLLARFWDVSDGEITYGNQPITHIKQEVLMKDISMVFQDVYLFKDTIWENIIIAKPDATKDEVHQATKLARCHDFIMALPNGYDTIIGEGGNTLSGGEKQRISIARAILKDAPIIFLDEATASLDPENELYIQEALTELVQDKTLIVIAHRLQSIIQADQIIVLQEGKIVEKGKHLELLAQNNLYAKMWDEQLQAKSWKF